MNEAAVVAAIADLLVALGLDPTTGGLRDTPVRLARFYREVMTPSAFAFTAFDGHETDEMVVQTGIPFYSLCEHHLVPFFGTAAVAYVPTNGRIVGLSKLARAVQTAAAGLRTQEAITQTVADLVEDALHPRGIGVVLRARHLCMEMRGARVPGTETTTSCLRGVFMESSTCRAEFLSLARP